MPISYQDIRNDRQWRAVTGLDQGLFKELTKLFKATYEDFHESSLLVQVAERTDDPKFTTYERTE